MQVGFLLVPQRLDPGASPSFSAITASGPGVSRFQDGLYITGTTVPANGGNGGVEITGSNTQGNVLAFRRGVGALPLVLQGAGSVVLVGTTTNSANGILQLLSHTTSAGGIGLGTDTSLFRSAAGAIRQVGTQTTYEVDTGTAGRVGLANASAGNAAIWLQSDGQMVLRSSGATAITLDTGQNLVGQNSLYAANSASAVLGWSSRSAFSSPSDGVITLRNAANNDFTRLQFGGTSASFPALKRTGTRLDVQLADGSNAAGMFADSYLAQNGITSTGATAGIGYAAGAGGAVTQLTSRTTGVTINKVCGQITLFAAAGSATATTFTVTNSTVAAGDVVQVVCKSGTNVYLTWVTAVAAGSFNITFQTTGGTASDSPVFTFAVIKAVAA